MEIFTKVCPSRQTTVGCSGSEKGRKDEWWPKKTTSQNSALYLLSQCSSSLHFSLQSPAKPAILSCFSNLSQT
eukprot:633716-Amorphochlora_amoeboformis.AAC.1